MAITIMVVSAERHSAGEQRIDRSRAAGAAGYVAGRVTVGSIRAVRRSVHVAIRFLAQSDGYSLQTYVDGNRNGVRTSDIVSGIDVPITAIERLVITSAASNWHSRGRHRIDPGPSIRPTRFKSQSALLSFNPTGSSTSGTGIYSRRTGQSVRGSDPRRKRTHTHLRIQRGRAQCWLVTRERRAVGQGSPASRCLEWIAHASATDGPRNIVNLSSGGALIETMALAAWRARRDSGRRAGTAVSRHWTHPALPRGAARPRTYSVPRRTDVRRAGSHRGSNDPAGRARR